MKRLVQWSRTKKAVLVIAVLVATVLAFVAIPAAEGGTESASSVLGVYVGYQAPATVKAFGNSIGAQPAYAMDFLDGDSWSALVDSAPSYFAAWKGSGYSMVWGIPILPNATAYSLADGAAGDYNSYFLTLAQDMMAGGQGSSIVRIGWEFNGGWFPWAANGQAAAFIGYWQQIVDTMRSVAGQDFKFEWNPTAGDLGVGNLANYYPGSAYVDYLGLDVYDQNWSTYPGGAAEFANIESEGYGLNWLSSFAAAQGKSIVLPEWGLGTVAGDGGLPYTAENVQTSGGDDPTFINDMAQWIQANGVVEATYWQFGIDALSPTSNPNSYAAFVSDFGGGSPPRTTTTTTSGSPPTSTTTTTTSVAPPPSSTTTTTTTSNPAPTSTTTTTTTSPPTTDATGLPWWLADGGRRGVGDSTWSTASTPSGSATFPGTDGGDTAVTLFGPKTALVTGSSATFSALFSNSSSGGARPQGQVSWTVTDASGTAVPCRGGNDAGIRRSGMVRCVVASQQLSATNGPYTVAVSYQGGNGFTAAAATMSQPVLPAKTHTWLRFTPASASGQPPSIAAVVSSRAAMGEPPTGNVMFLVSGSSGQSVDCVGGDTLPLSGGRATCTLTSALSSAESPYTMTVTYQGDGDFYSSMSKVGTISAP
jgi:hypothetical protein